MRCWCRCHCRLAGARDDQEMSPALLKHLSSIKRRAEQQIKLIESQGNLLKAMDVRLAELFRATRVHTRMLRELLLKEEEVPSLVIFLPPKPREGVAAALPEWVAKPESLFAQTLKLHFVCGVSMRVANTNNGEGFDVPFTKSWVRSAAPYLTAGLTVLKIAVAGGRLAGLPIPSLADSMDRILGTIKDAVLASDLMGGSGEDTVSSMFDKIRDKAAEEGKAVGEHLFSPSQDMPELCQEMKKSAAALKRVLPEDWESLVDLKPTVCIETGTKVWCLPEYQADIEERGIGSYLSEGPANQTIPPVRPENGRHGHSRPRSSTGLSAQPIGSAVSNGKPASKMCTLQ